MFLVDTGSSAADAKRLRAEIARTTKNKPVKWIALTHLHADSNDGLATFLPSDATIFVNAKTASLLVDFVGRLKGPEPNVIGVGERILLVAGKLRLEIGAAPANAHTSSDLYVFDAVTRTVFVGDLVTPDRCPMLSDPDSDIKGWLLALDRLDALHPVGLVASRGNPSANAAPEIEKTRRYLTSLLSFLVEKKKQNAPEARVSGELAAEKTGRVLPPRAERDQRVERLPAAEPRRLDRPGLPAEARAEVTPGPPGRGARASTVVWMPPRGVKTPRTAIRRGATARTRSSRTRFTTFSLKIPRDRNAFTYSLSDFSSTQSRSGT